MRFEACNLAKAIIFSFITIVTKEDKEQKKRFSLQSNLPVNMCVFDWLKEEGSVRQSSMGFGDAVSDHFCYFPKTEIHKYN